VRERPFVAAWSVMYPTPPEADQTWRLLQSMLLVAWNWDRFIWDLRELLRLLTTAPSEFNYLFVTDSLRARAAYLAANGAFDCTQQDILLGLGRHNVQFTSIYYRLLVGMLREVLGSEAGAQMIRDGEERLFMLAIKRVEGQYIEILQVIALDPDGDEEIHGHSLKSWISGEVLCDGRFQSAVPEDVNVRVVVQRCGRHRLVRPTARDMVRKIKRCEAFRSYLQRAGDMRRNDIEAEKLSLRPKIEGYQLVKYGDLEFQYYLTLTNDSKATLYVVCADRTMRIHEQNGVPPGTCPTAIGVFDTGGGDEDLYVVTFDSGAVGVYTIDFRPHKQEEHEHVPDILLKTPYDNGQMAHGTDVASAPQIIGAYCAFTPGQKFPAQGGVGGKSDHTASSTKRPEKRGNEGRGDVALENGDQKSAVGGEAVKIIGDFKMIQCGNRKLDLSRKHKARGFVRFLHDRLSGEDRRDFYVDEMRDAFNAEAPVGKPGRRWTSDRFREDLFKGKEKDFDLVFETLDKASGHYSLKL
jgi:hypothetical protein